MKVSMLFDIMRWEEKAKVAFSNPFTIQLLYATGETKQPVTLSING